MLSPQILPDMEISLKKNRMILKGAIHFENVKQILAIGNELLNTQPLLEVDFKHLHNSDSSGLALLCAWLRKAHTEKKALSFKTVPAFIRDIARVYGLDKVLESAWEN